MPTSIFSAGRRRCNGHRRVMRLPDKPEIKMPGSKYIKNTARQILLMAALIAWSCVQPVCGQTDWRDLHRQLDPPPALWQSIPWKISLVAAREQAAETGRPLFIWAMDGHPLGCT